MSIIALHNHVFWIFVTKILFFSCALFLSFFLSFSPSNVYFGNTLLSPQSPIMSLQAQNCLHERQEHTSASSLFSDNLSSHTHRQATGSSRHDSRIWKKVYTAGKLCSDFRETIHSQHSLLDVTSLLHKCWSRK